MAVGRITKRSVEGIPVPESCRAYLWDDQLKGFGVMVTPNASRSYVVQYRVGGRGSPTRRYTIGRHGSPWTAEKARNRAIDILEMVRRKIDPVEADRHRLRELAEARADSVRLAFSEYADAFIQRHAEARQLRSVEEIRSIFRRDLKPFFGMKSLPAITRSHIQTCLDRIHDRSGSAANKAHSWLRKMFSFAVNRGDLKSSPMEGMSAPHRERQRHRVLKGRELGAVWRAAKQLDDPWGPFVQLLLLLGQRLREVAGMRWEELDLPKAIWVIPASRTKNKRDHLVPLPAAAVKIIRRVAQQSDQREGPVLTTNGSTPISGFSKIKKALDEKFRAEIERRHPQSEQTYEVVGPWVFHDLRRSVGTGCQALGFPIEHTEALLNHVSGKRGGLAAVYQLHDYRQEKAAALNAWARHVERLGSLRTRK